MSNTNTTAASNRNARAQALLKELGRGNTPRAERLADKVFGEGRWNWASLYFRAALITGVWNAINA